MADEKFNSQAVAGESGEHLLARSYDVCALGQAIFGDLAGLFSAVKELSPDGTPSTGWRASAAISPTTGRTCTTANARR